MAQTSVAIVDEGPWQIELSPQQEPTDEKCPVLWLDGPKKRGNRPVASEVTSKETRLIHLRLTRRP